MKVSAKNRGKAKAGADRRGLNCEAVWREVSNYVDGSVETSLRRQIDGHLGSCPQCQAVVDGTRNLVQLAGDPRAFALPERTSRRLYSKLDAHLDNLDTVPMGLPQEIPVGITEDRVALGSHLIYFWETDDEFRRGVRFLYPGLGQGEHCIIFGHDEALQRALQTMRDEGYDPDELIRNLDLTVLRRHASAKQTLSDIGDVANACLKSGATAVRFLGNLGMGRDPLPAGEDDVLELETKVTSMISTIPCVVVCMYDVRTVSGRLILKGGLETHHLAVCGEGVRENPYYSPSDKHPVHVRHVH